MTTPQLGDHYYERKYSPPVSPRSQPQGLKRRAPDDEVENQSHISNHFKKLRLNNAKLPTPIEMPPVGVSLRKASSTADSPSMSPTMLPSPLLASPHHGRDEDYMRVDDTADRVFIRDLDAEIAEIEREEAQRKAQLFLPEFDKEVSKLPQHLLQHQNQADDPKSNMQMVLYQDPTSISVPEEEDAVRKAIIASRRRMREKQDDDRDEMAGAPLIRQSTLPIDFAGRHYYQPPDHMEADDPDAMDIG